MRYDGTTPLIAVCATLASLHHYRRSKLLVTNRDLRHKVGIPEEVQPATSDTTWVDLRNRRTTNCVNDLGQVTLKGNAQTEDPLRVKKYNGGLTSSWVGARRSSGQSPTSSWVGRSAGGARTLTPVFGRSLHSQELEDDLCRTKSLVSYATQLRRQRQALS